MEKRKPAYQMIDGVPRCVGMGAVRLRERLQYRAMKGDLVQITFPKSGTHWLMYITHIILSNGQPMTLYQEFAKEWRFLEYMDIEDFRSSLPLRTFPTHLALDKRTMTEEGKYVYLARNPWDVCVSFYHMMINMSLFGFQGGKFEDFLDVFNTREVALRLAYFLGEQYGRAVEKDEALLQELLDRSQPEYMRNVVVLDLTAKRNPQWHDVLSRSKITCIEGHEGDENRYAYVRTGKVGSWKDYFTADLLRKMENRIQEAEKESSFMDLWKDIRAEAITRMRYAE
ncbi:hypothetical protein MTO96_046907 [Rhipicephalus appendiculatus]